METWMRHSLQACVCGHWHTGGRGREGHKAEGSAQAKKKTALSDAGNWLDCFLCNLLEKKQSLSWSPKPTLRHKWVVFLPQDFNWENGCFVLWRGFAKSLPPRVKPEAPGAWQQHSWVSLAFGVTSVVMSPRKFRENSSPVRWETNNRATRQAYYLCLAPHLHAADTFGAVHHPKGPYFTQWGAYYEQL